MAGTVSGMIWGNSIMWADRTQVKKGDMGEAFVDAYLASKNIVPYKPVFDGAHPFDRLLATPDKKELFILEIKTKARRTYYPDTGINIKHYEEYRHIAEKHKLKIYMVFVDEHEKRIYGNFLNLLDRPLIVDHNGKRIEYPLRYGKIIYFPLEAMRHIGCLSDCQSEELKSLTVRNYGYELDKD